MKAIIKWLLGLTAVACVSAGAYGNAPFAAVRADAANAISATVTEVNNERLDNGASFVMVLSANDYMTADEWSNTNYKWLNAEDVKTLDGRADVNYSACNVANAELDQNLDEYNFEEFIYVDGVSLAEFSQTNEYKLIANKRTRPNTISLDFTPEIMSGIEKIEIKEGCQLPTLAYAYRGVGDFSFIEIEETSIYENRDGQWFACFEGYEEGVEYGGGEQNFQLSPEDNFKGHTAVPLDAHTDFFKRFEIQGERLDTDALVSAGNTEKDNLMVLRFVNPIDTTQFNRLRLRVYINHQIDVLTYNADAVTAQDLGPALESLTVDGGQFTYLTLNSALYANDSGKLDTIVFKFVQDCQPQVNEKGEIIYSDAEKTKIIRDTFHFVSFRVENEENTVLVTENSFMIVDGGDRYDLTFRFQKLGVAQSGVLDTSKVLLNGCSLASVLAECPDATAEWYSAKGIYQINASLPKSYTGKAQIKNAEYGFAGNNMRVEKGLVFPSGEALEKSYTCHLYAGENLLDGDLVENYKPVSVDRIAFSFVEGSGNLNFSIYFSGAITSSLYNHACEREDWREELNDKIAYDEGSSDIFIRGGFKSSLLDCVIVGGRSIGEWHAYDAAALTCVQVFYGAGLQFNRMDVRFESATKSTYDQLYGLASSGNGLTVEVLSGLRFATNARTEKTQSFIMQDGKFIERLGEKALHVYFDGREVQDGQEITVQTVVAKDSVSVAGVTNYVVSCEEKDGKKVYTVTYGENKSFCFTVTEDIMQKAEEEKKGCSSAIAFGSATMALLASAAWILLGKGGKRHEEN